MKKECNTQPREPNRSKTLYVIPQMHKIPGMNEIYMQICGMSQFMVLNTLYSNNFKNIFVESLYEDFTPNDPARDSNKLGMANVVNMYFPNHCPSLPNNLQTKMLAEVGAAQVYAYLNPDVTLHKTISKQHSDNIDEKVKELLETATSPNDIFKSPYIMEHRESFAVDHIKRFFDETNYERAALIFGMAHKFEPYFKDSEIQVIRKLNDPTK